MNSKQPIKEIVDFWIEFFKNYNLDEERLIKALFIDMVFRLDNSIIEESTPARTNRWISIINELFLKKNKFVFSE